MPNLLALPVEVRYIIISNVLDSGRDPPTWPLSENSSQKIWEIHEENEEIGRLPRFREKGSMLMLPGYPLLLVNHQLYRETKEAMRVFPEQRLNYVLDIMYDDSNKSYPTWLRLPKFSRRIETLRVQIRTFSLPERRLLGEHEQWYSNAVGGHRSLARHIFWVLRYILQVRVSNIQAGRMDYGMVIKKVNIHFLTPPDEEENFLRTSLDPRRCVSMSKEKFLFCTTNSIADQFKSRLAFDLQPRFRGPMHKYVTRSIFDQVEDIGVFVGESSIFQINLPECLACYEPDCRNW